MWEGLAISPVLIKRTLMFICENHQALILISEKLEAKSLDQMPQLLQDKAMMEGSSSQADISLGNPVGYKVQLYNRTSTTNS